MVSGGERPVTVGFARRLTAVAPRHDQIAVLGPAEAPLAVIKGRYRFRILVKAARSADLSSYLRQWMAIADRPTGSLKLEIDVDPQSFL
jgi:primosomal protein N' (replication factor Y)